MSVILCGGLSEIQIYENRDRLIDGLNSCRSAMKGGILPGGGTALLKGQRILDFIEVENHDQKIGVELVKMACLEPIKTLVKNGGFDQTIVSELLEKYEDENYMGFNLRSAKIENLIESGIFDALNVVTSTLIDAVSISSMILTTECVIANSKTYTRSFIFFANIQHQGLKHSRRKYSDFDFNCLNSDHTFNLSFQILQHLQTVVSAQHKELLNIELQKIGHQSSLVQYLFCLGPSSTVEIQQSNVNSQEELLNFR